jgi:hypothetical protein
MTESLEATVENVETLDRIRERSRLALNRGAFFDPSFPPEHRYNVPPERNAS